MTLALLMDLILVCMLGTMIAYCVVLNRRLGHLRRTETEMKTLMAKFAEATERAEANLQSIKLNAVELSSTIGRQVARGGELSQELDVMIVSAERVAERLDGKVAEQRSANVARFRPQAELHATAGTTAGAAARRAPAEAETARPLGSNPKSGEREAAEQALLQALRAAR